MRILGIDPGSRFCGYCVLESKNYKYSLIEAGLIKIKPSTLQYQITEPVSYTHLRAHET
ncbi:MAG TPA: crossover junction endodeoxyribonuclease RuvC, partial [Campylobacter avium]|nr:crossover junction endodeoxyribonuclease RuvC [Campylobacter avium]